MKIRMERQGLTAWFDTDEVLSLTEMTDGTKINFKDKVNWVHVDGTPDEVAERIGWKKDD